MVLAIETVQQVPLRVDESGAVRVGKTRVLLELVIGNYVRGASPEEIIDDFPTLELADVYAVIAYYLRHKAEIDAYMEQVEADAEESRKLIESQPGYAEFIQRVKERYAARNGNSSAE